MTIVNNSKGRLEYDQEFFEINEQQLDIISKKLSELFSLHVVVSSLPSKEEMEMKLDFLIENKQESFKTKYDKLTFKFGFRTCFYWLNKKLNK